MGFINMGMEKSRLYGIGSLMWRSGISTSSELLTMQRQWSSTKRTSSRFGTKKEESDTDEEENDTEDNQEDGEGEGEGEIFMVILLSMNTGAV